MRKSDERLSAALREAGLSVLADKAAAGYYNEFFGELDTPMIELMHDLATVASKETLALRARVMQGEFDAGNDEADEWAKLQGILRHKR